MQCNLDVNKIDIKNIHSKEYSINISKLISKTNDIHNLKHIHSLLIINNDLSIATALIKQYGKLNDIDNALNVFDSIDKKERDHIIIGVVMQCLLNNKCYQKMFDLYECEEFHKLHNDIINVLKLKACMDSKNFDKGKKIYDYLACTNSMNTISVQLKTCLIGFYGHFNDIETAMELFNLFNCDSNDIIITNSMLTVLINNKCYENALVLFEKINYSMKNIVSFIIGIKICIGLNDMKYFQKDTCIHNEIINKQFENQQRLLSFI